MTALPITNNKVSVDKSLIRNHKKDKIPFWVMAPILVQLNLHLSCYQITLRLFLSTGKSGKSSLKVSNGPFFWTPFLLFLPRRKQVLALLLQKKIRKQVYFNCVTFDFEVKKRGINHQSIRNGGLQITGIRQTASRVYFQ